MSRELTDDEKKMTQAINELSLAGSLKLPKMGDIVCFYPHGKLVDKFKGSFSRYPAIVVSAIGFTCELSIITNWDDAPIIPVSCVNHRLNVIGTDKEYLSYHWEYR